jgi:hypothetical protein
VERLTISKALGIAEQQTAEARQAKDSGDPEGEERLQQWSDTLHALEVLKERGVPESMKDG